MCNLKRLKMENLETKRCILRPISLDDAPSLFECYKHDIVVKYLPIRKHNTISDTKRFIRLFFLKNYNQEKISHYAIVLKKENKVIGNVGFNNISNSSENGEMGICINPSYWGLNLSKELAKAIIEYGFYSLNLKTISVDTFEDNKYSRRPIEELGFKHVQTFIKNLHHTKSKRLNYVKCYKYELLKKDYEKLIRKESLNLKNK